MTTLRMIGGRDKSWAQRLPAVKRLRESSGEQVEGGWKDQCRCGQTTGKKYRKTWWCPRCGREKLNFPKGGSPLTKTVWGRGRKKQKEQR